ncbi:MAG: CDP-alcohol phosphatidyltransferase family protein [Actinomycetota bacterium]
MERGYRATPGAQQAGSALNPNLNPANAVTASRFLTLPPFVYFVDRGLLHWAMVMVIVCGLLDLVDGKVARAFDCITPFGEVFDATSNWEAAGTPSSRNKVGR